MVIAVRESAEEPQITEKDITKYLQLPLHSTIDDLQFLKSFKRFTFKTDFKFLNSFIRFASIH